MMRMYKVWDSCLDRWLEKGMKTKKSSSAIGKVWQTVGHLRSAIAYQLPSQYRWERYPDEARRREDLVLDRREVVVYEVREVERIPLREWLNRDNKN